jgi:hypothetical protein
MSIFFQHPSVRAGHKTGWVGWDDLNNRKMDVHALRVHLVMIVLQSTWSLSEKCGLSLRSTCEVQCQHHTLGGSEWRVRVYSLRKCALRIISNTGACGEAKINTLGARVGSLWFRTVRRPLWTSDRDPRPISPGYST